MSHNYFGWIWKETPPDEKNKLLETLARGKGIISKYSFNLAPENGDFFQKSEFFSELKKKFVSDEDY